MDAYCSTDKTLLDGKLHLNFELVSEIANELNFHHMQYLFEAKMKEWWDRGGEENCSPKIVHTRKTRTKNFHITSEQICPFGMFDL